MLAVPPPVGCVFVAGQLIEKDLSSLLEPNAVS